MRFTIALFASILLGGAARAAPPTMAAGTDAAITAHLDRAYPHLFDVYRDIHSHPELGFHEIRTAALLAREIRMLGFEVTERFGGTTGIVAIYRNGPGPVVMIRTELDALPMEEKTGLPYASRVQEPASDFTAPGQPADPATVGKLTYVDHSCGHDIHMAWWLGTASALVALKDRWHGTLMFVAEPAEEIGGGATALLKAGLFRLFPKPDVAFAAHVMSDAAGTVTLKDGAVTGNSDTFRLTFKGRGAHGAMPQAAIDPIVESARFVMDVQTVVSREKAPDKAGVISVGSIVAGSTANIIPDHADLKLTMRSDAPEVRALLLAGMERTAKASAMMSGAPEPTFQRIGFGATAVVNDSHFVAQLRPIMDAAFGSRLIYQPASLPGGTAAETFSEFAADAVPSVFFWVGGNDPAMLARAKAEGVAPPINHSPDFAPVPEISIKTGARLLTLAVLTVAAPSR